MDLSIAVARGILGIGAILGLALLLSEHRRRANWRMVLWALLLQLIVAILILKGEAMAGFFAPLGWPKALFSGISSLFVLLLQFTTDGAAFVLGDLALPPEGPMEPGTPIVSGQSWGNAIAFQVLPTIIFFGAFMAVLYHLGVMQRVVRWMALLVVRLLKTSGAESLSVTANVFVGQTEAPLVIRPYLEGLTRSELMAVMTGGMATIAGGVMAAYIIFLAGPYAAAQGIAADLAQVRFAEHLLGASLMAAPAALIMAKILVPETHQPATLGVVDLPPRPDTRNVIDAAARGAGDGLKLLLNVAAMLIAFIALIAALDYGLAWSGGLVGVDLSMERITGWAFAPVAFMIGVPAADITEFGALLGSKIVANEFVAYLQLAEHLRADTLAPKTTIMATFALCGFANLSSIAIQIGGIGPLAPNQRALLAELGLKAVLAGTLANLMTATIAGVVLG